MLILAIGTLAFSVVLGAMVLNDVRENSAFFGLAEWLITVGVTIGVTCTVGTAIGALL